MKAAIIFKCFILFITILNLLNTRKIECVSIKRNSTLQYCMSDEVCALGYFSEDGNVNQIIRYQLSSCRCPKSNKCSQTDDINYNQFTIVFRCKLRGLCFQ
ncbi:hypothetical protein ACKWTF_011431 [Chironomus riparius]